MRRRIGFGVKLLPPPGVFTDYAPLDAQPFWYRSENVRFRLALPQTVGLYSRFVDKRTGEPVDEQFPSFLRDTSQVDLYADDNLLIIASGRRIVIIRWALGDIEVRTVPGLGPSGRWWFGVTEENIIAGRGNLDGRAVAINRATRDIVTIPNVPQGCIAGGVYAGILLLAGTTSIGEGRTAMTLRWSARRTDSSSSGTEDGPFGFEDWIPSDLNSSGEIELMNGSTIKAGGTTIFGFIVWTDTASYEITARPDINVFAETQISGRGILGPRTWVVADDRLWWYDQTRTLNVYDGGRARQVICPMRNSTLEAVLDEGVGQLSLSSDVENGEVSLHYPDRNGLMRELVYNYREDVWYTFNLNRLNMISANGPRPSIGMETSGRLMFYDLREVQPDFQSVTEREPAAYREGDQPFQPAPDPEPFDYFLQTNWITAGNASVKSLRARNVVVAYTFAKSDFTAAEDDLVALKASSYGRLDLREPPTEDEQEKEIGDMLFNLRVGGKAVQYTISGAEVRTFLRFGAIDIEADEGGKR